MALKMTTEVEYESGATIQAPKAYIRIDDFSGQKTDATIYVNTYLDQPSADGGKQPIEPTKIITFPHSVEDDAPNIVKQGYEYLKTLPEYESAIDV